MQTLSPLLWDTTLSGIAMGVFDDGPSLDLGAKGTYSVSFHIEWEDVAVTWQLERGNGLEWDDFTATYRIGDPGWVDPLLGDPRQHWIVAFMNPGTRYVRLNYSAGNFGGGAKFLKVVAHLNRVFK